MILQVLSNLMILWFYDFKILHTLTEDFFFLLASCGSEYKLIRHNSGNCILDLFGECLQNSTAV